MDIKKRLLDIFYTSQVGYGPLSWLVSLVAYTSIVVLAVHFIIPSISAELISIVTPIGGFIFFYVFGYFWLRHKGYATSQTFGGDKNPTRTNWVSENTKAKLMIAQSEVIREIAKKFEIDTSILDAPTREVEAVQKEMEELLK